MNKTTRRKLLRPLHAALTALSAACGWASHLLERVGNALGRAAAVCDPARGAADYVELRDALTGEPLGMTKAQYRRYVIALGTDNPATIIRAAREVQERRRRVLASWAGVACLLAIAGCTRSNSARLCVPGQQQECACPGSQKGAQACLEDGSGFAECQGCSQASLDLAAVDFAQPDLAGVDFAGADFAGSTPPDLVSTAYVGIACGSSTCGPVNGVLGCCSNLTGAEACYADTAGCPPSYVGVALCDGPEDCPGQVCAASGTVDKNNTVLVDEMRCRPTGSFSNQFTVHKTNNIVDSVSMQSVACHSADDCVGQTATHPQFGTVAVPSCCHYQGDEHYFCSNSALVPSAVVCP